jgi:branched-chain amino acid transport system substrate-binding protein
MKLTCADHSGHNKVFVSQWDGAKYVKASEWMDPIKDVVRPLIEEEAKSFVGKDPGWPKRTEACDKAG